MQPEVPCLGSPNIIAYSFIQALIVVLILRRLVDRYIVFLPSKYIAKKKGKVQIWNLIFFYSAE